MKRTLITLSLCLSACFLNAQPTEKYNPNVEEVMVLANWGNGHVVVVVDTTDTGGYVCMDPLKGTYITREGDMTNFVGSQFTIEISGIK